MNPSFVLPCLPSSLVDFFSSLATFSGEVLATTSLLTWSPSSLGSSDLLAKATSLTLFSDLSAVMSSSLALASLEESSSSPADFLPNSFHFFCLVLPFAADFAPSCDCDTSLGGSSDSSAVAAAAAGLRAAALFWLTV